MVQPARLPLVLPVVLRLAILTLLACCMMLVLALTLGPLVLRSRVLVYAAGAYQGFVIHSVDIDRHIRMVISRSMIADWFSLACSPDGRQVVFPARPAGRAAAADLYQMNFPQGDITPLLHRFEIDLSPRWSPDGHSIAFVSALGSGEGGIVVANRDGTSPEQVADNAVVDQMPDWSPDGKQIVFTATGDQRPEIAVVTLGEGWKPLTHNDVFDGLPVWSPDGSRLAFVSFRDDNYDLYLMDGDGGSVQRLTWDAAFDTEPAWSPDGSRLAFVSSRGGQREVYLMEADGSNQRVLAQGLAVRSEPVWSRDGTLLAALSKRDGNPELYLIRADGSGYWRLTDNEDADFLPAWCG